MMKKLLSAVALTVAFAMPSVAATLSGTFTIDIRNFFDTATSGPGANVVTQGNSAATAANFNAQASDAVITYTGNINFGIGSGNSNTTTIANFLASAGGVVTASPAAQAFLNSTLLSQGSYVTTTFFKITGKFLSSYEGTITHDDGITLLARDLTGGVSAPPTSQRNTKFTATGGNFTLYYASANGNPSILKIDVSEVPVPAAGFLLVGALGGLMALRRRKTA
jgi:hypothetical protein